jgi:hypothetical protein
MNFRSLVYLMPISFSFSILMINPSHQNVTISSAQLRSLTQNIAA